MKDSSLTLKGKPYEEIYYFLRENHNFNMLMMDDAMIQIFYQFHGTDLVKHRLAFFPSPDLEEYHGNSEIYAEDDLYADIIRRNIVTTPIRFDFDMSAFKDGMHPASHLTIGEYKNCRIPVVSPLTPSRFLTFILESFYNTSYQKYCSDWKWSEKDFDSTITSRERLGHHLSFGRRNFDH